MKAVIMAGGEGTRLRPVSSNRPKPMVRLFDKPVLEHIIELLKKNGINESCLTLRYMPQIVTDHFGDGSRFGITLDSRVEETPLGTAGGVKACEDFIGDEPFLVISGDAVCDFDLKKCIDFHNEKNAEVTIVLYAHPSPLEYGLVMAAPDGRVERFIEKPPWDKVFTNLINTGIYIISAKVLKDIPENKTFDFAKDLFPALLAQNRGIYAYEATGYWCDIGSSEAYLQCGMDALSGKLSLDIGAPETQQDVWSNSEIPQGVSIAPPCYIGGDVMIEPGASIGPFTILGEGSRIGKNAVISGSMIDGAFIGNNVTSFGSVVCCGAAIQEGVVLGQGSIIGEGTQIGGGSVVSERVRIWPGIEIPSESRINRNLVGGMLPSSLRFSEGGQVRGEFGTQITPEACFTIGAALGSKNKMGLCFSGGSAARIAALAMECGLCSSGATAIEMDCSFPAAASWAAYHYGLPALVFVGQTGDRLELHFFGDDGKPITRDDERKIENAISTGEYPRASASSTGSSDSAFGTLRAYISAACRAGLIASGDRPALEVSVAGYGSASRALKKTLEGLGCKLSERRRGIPVFEITEGGFSLHAEDENGIPIDFGRILVMLALVEFEDGSGRAWAPYTAPAALDVLAMNYGAKVLRLGRDGTEAEDLYISQPFMRDGIFAAARLCSALSHRRESLASLSDRIPAFRTLTREVEISVNRGALMRELSGSCAEMSTELLDGLRVDTGLGRVHLTPSVSHSALKIISEASDMEAAEELQTEFIKRIKNLEAKINTKH